VTFSAASLLVVASADREPKHKALADSVDRLLPRWADKTLDPWTIRENGRLIQKSGGTN
jgi:hypothetical protein